MLDIMAGFEPVNHGHDRQFLSLASWEASDLQLESLPVDEQTNNDLRIHDQMHWFRLNDLKRIEGPIPVAHRRELGTECPTRCHP